MINSCFLVYLIHFALIYKLKSVILGPDILRYMTLLCMWINTWEPSFRLEGKWSIAGLRECPDDWKKVKERKTILKMPANKYCCDSVKWLYSLKNQICASTNLGKMPNKIISVWRTVSHAEHKKFKVPLPGFQFSVSLASLQTILQYDNVVVL